MSRLLTKEKKWLWNEGRYIRCYEVLGAHKKRRNKKSGVQFTVWAPNAHSVSVVGDFNNWDGREHPMTPVEETGLWTVFVPGLKQWALYKYEIKTAEDAPPFLKTDPYAFVTELRPKTAALVYDLDSYKWDDEEWMNKRSELHRYDQPISIYEVHIGSWRRKGEHQEYLTYRELADEMVDYVTEMGYTHIELMPVAEHPYDPSWGYQIIGYFAPTSRFGDPKDFMYFVDRCHQAGIGIILDWVPGHFPKDEQGLQMFDGEPLYEHEDIRRREQKDWGTHIFDYGKPGVRNFLLSNAMFWLDKYHIDGLRVDAVASMLYLDYSKGPGEWAPNKYGGRENLEAIDFLQQTNNIVHEHYPGVLTFAEESTSWAGVTHSTDDGGLGFDFKWNMGWMNDTLTYMEKKPSKRLKDPEKITFPMVYAMHEKFVLPLSHDEVVHMKKPLVFKSPGSDEDKFANLRLLLTYQYGHPGKKLLFMGGEFAQTSEWAEDRPLEWYLLEYERHQGVQNLAKDLLKLYKNEKALHELDHSFEGFEWIDLGEHPPGLFSFLRKAHNPENHLFFMLNFSGSTIENYLPGPFKGRQYEMVLNSNSAHYGGHNWGGIWQEDQHQRISISNYTGIILKPK